MQRRAAFCSTFVFDKQEVYEGNYIRAIERKDELESEVPMGDDRCDSDSCGYCHLGFQLRVDTKGRRSNPSVSSVVPMKKAVRVWSRAAFFVR